MNHVSNLNHLPVILINFLKSVRHFKFIEEGVDVLLQKKSSVGFTVLVEPSEKRIASTTKNLKIKSYLLLVPCKIVKGSTLASSIIFLKACLATWTSLK